MSHIIKIFLLLIFVTLSCCTSNFTYNSELLRVGEQNTVFVSDVFFRKEMIEGIKRDDLNLINGESFAYELVVVSIDQNKLGLAYAEYTKGLDAIFSETSPWLIRGSFGQKYEYPITSKNIKFRKMEFSITDVGQDFITYKRVK